MNIDSQDPASPEAIAARRTANNAFRSTLAGGQLLLSAGIVGLGADNQALIVASVRGCVLPVDDPLDAHDIGDIEVLVTEPGIASWHELIFFRVVTPGPATPGTTGTQPINSNHRQLVILLASQWWLGTLEATQ